MSFTDQRAKIQGFSGATTPEYQLKYLAQEAIDALENLDNKYLDHLTVDITGLAIPIDLKDWLTNNYYGPSNEYARDCLEVCMTVDHLYGRKIKSWTDHALKCYDNFLLKYIQEDRKESVKKKSKYHKEREVYEHLINLGDVLQEIGQAFDNIYEMRNSFQHITVYDEKSGIRTPRKMSNKKYNQKRDQIVQWLKDALKKLLGLLHVN